MRILQIVPSLEQEASGPSYSVPQLANALADLGNDVRLMSVGGQAAGVDVRCEQSRYPNDWNAPEPLKHLWSSRALKRALDEAAPRLDVIHAHGLWAMPDVYPARAASKAGIPFVLSPRGTLGAAALRFSRHRKRLFWLALQGAAVRSARCLHATSVSEYEEIRAFGLRQPVTIVPNGVDLPDLAERPWGEAKTALYLGRIHPKKGLEGLLQAWREVGAAHPDWRLRIVGPGDPRYLAELRALAEREGVARVSFDGPLYGADKQLAYRQANLFVMPTLNENFGMTVAEALSNGVPVICTKGAPWEGLMTHGGGWWIDHGREAMAAALRRAMDQSPEALARIGLAGRAWMSEAFSWAVVGAQMQATYQWLREGGKPPQTVRLD